MSIPDLLPADIQIPCFDGEAKLFQLCNRFHVPEGEMITCFREFCSNPKNIPRALNDKLLCGALETIPVSSAEAERGSSQMNLIVTQLRSKTTVSHVASLLFINVNGPPPHLLNPASAAKLWLQRHRSAIDTRVKSSRLISVEELNCVQKLYV